MQMAETPDYKNVLIITVGLRRWQRAGWLAGWLAEFVRLHKEVQCVH